MTAMAVVDDSFAALARRAAAERDLERVADGVWLLRGGVPRRMNVYLLEDAGGGPAAFNEDTEQARASLRKLAALEPAAAWPGHLDPLTGDVRAQLERAAAV